MVEFLVILVFVLWLGSMLATLLWVVLCNYLEG